MFAYINCIFVTVSLTREAFREEANGEIVDLIIFHNFIKLRLIMCPFRLDSLLFPCIFIYGPH